MGVGLTAWHYMWRITPMHRHEEPGELPRDAPPPLPDGVTLEEVQRPADGAGALMRRRYRVRIRDAEHSAEEVMARFAADPNRAAPTEFAIFQKMLGDEGRLQVGDEFVVRMPGPWDGPVRVVDVTPTSFRLATLDGHLEAGQVEFRARDGDGDGLEFSIESWARSGDRLSHLMFDKLRLSKEVQLHMWTSVLERVAGLAGGRRDGAIEIRTRRVDDEESTRAR